MAKTTSAPDGNLSRSSREIIRHFTPAWFAAIMATGAISILLYSFPYGRHTLAMRCLSLAFFFLNLLLFMLFTTLTIMRYASYPHTWTTMLHDPVSSLYTGCFPMGVTTLINVMVDVIHADFQFGGSQFLYFIWAVWWADVAISILCCWGMVHIMTTTHKHSLQAMTSAWILPVVTLTVAASSGGVLARALQNYSPLHALISVAVAVFLVTIGLTLALMIMTIYLLRLIAYGLPPGPKIISSFLPLGPTAQSGYAFLLIGQNFKSLLPLDHGVSDFLKSREAGQIIHTVCICMAFMLWSLAVMSIIFALMGIFETVRHRRIPFGLPFWGLVFPNGVFANLTINLSIAFDSNFFRILGSIYSIATFLVWVFVATRTVALVYDRSIFEPQVDGGDDIEKSRIQEQQKVRKGRRGCLISRAVFFSLQAGVLECLAPGFDEYGLP
ncbi:putative voltage-dependent anion channel [Lyophyllum shimeji]|uniref:Voltage-dependent anion channel n=1 Tax=Lyophyllum shimeji TaxID=47721 RepID=A0A9P3UKX9_LYOSH|nr:putative voltage-dependent anion channel [Lyophyllum shimeji]